jgi:hypothetical protein
MHYREGDVILEREPLGRIGAKEARNFVWVLASFPDDVEHVSARVNASDVILDKARFNLSVGTLQAALPTFDISRARDPNDVYQPFLPVSSRAGGSFVFGTPTQTLNLAGRIHDKQLGRTR